ncbi:MAG TPA: hypothetical protein GXZ90_07325 [Clostridiales bacterium]|nr:hypothetical protein [Clostridiales bacterium]
MSIKILYELHFFIISIISGVILLLVYDLLRILRRIIKHNDIIVVVEDLLFWIASSLWLFSIMYKENNGIIRAFSILGMLIGSIAYNYFISDLFVGSISFVINKIIQPFKHIIHKVKTILGKFLKIIYKRLNKCIVWVKIRLYKRKKATTLQKEKAHEK